MIQVLLDNPLLLLFVVAALGYALGRITIGGSSLGVAAVLFVGLGFGALHPDLRLPDLIYQLGLVIFVYTIGLSSGRQFFASFDRKGLRDNLFVVGMLIFGAILTIGAGRLLGLRPTVTAGLFTGSLTNTAALAAVLDYVRGTASGAEAEQLLADPVVAFSITYPVGVIGMILAIYVCQRIWKVDYAAEARQPNMGMPQQLGNRTVVVTQGAATESTVAELVTQQDWNVVFGRMRRAGEVDLTGGETHLEIGDLVNVVAPQETLDRVTAFLGKASDEQIELDRTAFDYRRVFVSNPAIVGRRLRDLDLPRQVGAFVTRVRRGDIEMLGRGDTVLELGDRVRVIARRENMDKVSRFFGDSYRALSEIDILTFTLGLALGLLVGMIPIPVGPDLVIRLGIAGGPLIVALILGARERTGPLVWTLPYSANLTLRQIGLILFLAGVGTRSGYAFVSTLSAGGGGTIFFTGIAVTVVTALLALSIGRHLLRVPMGVLIGMLAGLQTQPALLGYALEQTGDDRPNVGYTAVYPIALITKILFAQLLVALL
jgi:putative transport protein